MSGRALVIVLLCATIAHAGPGPSATAPAVLAKSDRPYIEALAIATKEATQAAAADGQFVYAVSNKQVVKIDRQGGKEVARSTGAAAHLNSAFVWDGAVYCAHSNYPKKPDESDIRVLDPATMVLKVFHVFQNPPGSLTFAVRKDGHWWCHFAHYGDANAKSVLIRYDGEWKEIGRWSYPPAVVAEWGRYSASGGIWDGDDLLITGHDKREIYRLRVPRTGTVLEAVESIRSPFPGQGIAVDPVTGGLVGVDRAGGKVVIARRRSGE